MAMDGGWCLPVLNDAGGDVIYVLFVKREGGLVGVDTHECSLLEFDRFCLWVVDQGGGEVAGGVPNKDAFEPVGVGVRRLISTTRATQTPSVTPGMSK